MSFSRLPSPVQRGIIMFVTVIIISLGFLGAMALLGIELFR
jgi:hypothetical protein